MQALVEQQVGVGGQRFPLGEGARLLPERGGFLRAVQVVPVHSGAGFRIRAEQVLQVAEQVVLRAEVAEVHVAGAFRLGHLDFHLGAVMAVEAVAFDHD
ncbi:hypothetical protein D9M69_573760 [compost metagenome]